MAPSQFFPIVRGISYPSPLFARNPTFHDDSVFTGDGADVYIDTNISFTKARMLFYPDIYSSDKMYSVNGEAVWNFLCVWTSFVGLLIFCLFQGILGGKVDVPTLYGKIQITVRWLLYYYILIFWIMILPCSFCSFHTPQ